MIVLDRPEPHLDGRQLDRLCDLWLADCADRLDDLRPDGTFGGTTAGYAAKLLYFRQWWGAYGPGHGWVLTRADLREFERWLRMRVSRYGQPLGYHSRKDGLRRLRAMLEWAQAENYIVGVTPAGWVPAPAGDPPVRALVQDGELLRLLLAARETSVPLRNLAILAVLIGTGVRRAECAGLRIEDVTVLADTTGQIVVRNTKRTKRGKVVRTVAFDAMTGRYLVAWLDALATTTGPLFPSRRTGESLTPRSLGRIVRQCWDIAGLPADQPCHDLRRKFVTEWRRLHRGADLDELLQRQVGHVNASMTTHYSLQGVEDLLSVFTSPMASVGAMGLPD